MHPTSILLARQPIFDRKLNIIAYELLFRSADAAVQHTMDGDQATSHVLLNAFTQLPIDEVVESKQAFVNFTRNLIINPPPIHQDHLVIEVLETVTYDNAVHEGLLSLKEKGYTIALDDFEYNESLIGLIELADIIKLDVLALDQNSLKEHLRLLEPYAVKLLAEKVETYEVFELCKDLGFDYFQGYFLAKPQLVSGTTASENKQAILKLIGTLQSKDVDIDEVINAISVDPILSFKLLRLLNSSVFNLSAEISSIRHAVSLLGLQKIKRWTTLLILSDSGDKPKALAIISLNRSRLCQLLGIDIVKDSEQSESFFTAGLMSTLDAFFNTKIENLLPTLSLAEEVEKAILQGEGMIGFALTTAKLCENADWDNIDWAALNQYGITPDKLEQHYLDSIRWTHEIMQEI